MDIKVDGLSMDVMRQALAQAHQGRMHILEAMYNCMPEYRPELKPQTPRIEQMIIDREFIGAIIGPGGKVIQEIQRETGTEINIEEVDEKGIIKIFSKDATSNAKAIQWIKGIVAIPEVGETYEAVVKSIMPYGAFVEFMPGKQGLLHISEVSWKRLDNLDGVLTENDNLKVKLVGLDPKTGKFRLSRKVLMPKPEGYVEKPEGESRGGRNSRHDSEEFKGRKERHRAPEQNEAGASES
jgi:polyribonucleotide nucleotidyltransferase